MFRHLRTKLTVLYAGLFALALMLVSLVVYASISANARGVVRGELLSSGTVFDRVWALRARQLEGGAGLLSRDFGFREAVASRDEATIRSALENLRVRLGIDMAFIVGVDGSITGADGAQLKDASRQIMRAVEQDDNPSGVMQVGGTPYQTIAAPILSPTLVGWVVFSSRLDAREMQSLERLSAIPLDAVVLGRDETTHAWSAPPGVAGVVHGMAPAKLGRMIDSALAMATPDPRDVTGDQGDALTLVKPLKSIGGEAPAALLLSYPMARAMAPYSPMLYMIVLTGAGGIALLIYGSWILASGVTRPISALDQAAQRLQRGEDAEVEVTTSDEMGRLAASFNAMAAEIRERERRITHLAMHDAETNLPNRLALDRAVEIMAPKALEAGHQVAVLSLGIDRFAHVRGAIGYTLASALIAELGQALQRLRPGDPIGHLANGVIGLAFTVRDLEEARRIAGHLQAALEAPVRLGENAVDVTLTVGLAAWPELVSRPGSLINRASVAMDQARAKHAKLAPFDAEAYGDPQAKLSLMSEMLGAIRSGDIFIALQPKYDLRQSAVVGVEALVRWRHPVRGMVGPDEFIPMAEETGHIGALTEHVLTLAIAHQAALRDAGHRLSMSINISGRSVGDGEFAELALQMARKAVGELCFEITETAVISNPEVALTNLERFAAAGIRISIDDYGSGLSSLAYLKQMRAHELKIDKAFVIGMENSQKDALLVRSTVDLAHSLGMQVTAEGVETEVAQALLSAMGCDIAQGYWIARPMPIDDLMTYLRGRSSSVVEISTAKVSRPKSGASPPLTEAGR
jgi:EAL domain-containing protein (putative c-di-GMP-specific phosphodiesterase class I)/GGDEF domain-containing protein